MTGSLSPSRASDFKTCPLLYRLRSIDRLPERPSLAAARGTLVHAVLDKLFDLPAAVRTPQTAAALLLPQWDGLRADWPELDDLVADPAELAVWLASARNLLTSYFHLEDPATIEPEHRETMLEVVLPDGLRLRGIVDRVDPTPDGLRVVDYKTGRSPSEFGEARALFQLKFYALVLWRLRGAVPDSLRLMYLGDAQTLTFRPDAEGLDRFERTLRALWAAIARALADRDFPPAPGSACTWCDFRAYCPAWGGTPPPYPEPAADSIEGAADGCTTARPSPA